MYIMLFELKRYRIQNALSQVKLAQVSGVSLPTIQNIEAGKANPTLEIVERLAKALGLMIRIEAAPFDINTACALGVPLLSEESQKPSLFFQPNVDKVIEESRKWLQGFHDHTFGERETVALIAFLAAVRDHYFSTYQLFSNSVFEKLISQYRTDGRVIKLRRIALVNVGKYL